MSFRELATVLVALRHWQMRLLNLSTAELIAGWPQFEAAMPLTIAEIDDLCTRLNELPCGCEVPGPFCCGIPGILARIVAGRIAPASIERCDACERFPSDAAAQDWLRELKFIR